MKFDGDIIIIDPCTAVKSKEDWYKCGFGSNMTALGFSEFVYADVGGDSLSRIVDSDSGEVIGTVCTDSCVFVVLLFDELMQYYPDFSDHIRYPQNSVILRDFKGDIYTDSENRITGYGSVNFRTE